jgi:MFS family permease
MGLRSWTASRREAGGAAESLRDSQHAAWKMAWTLGWTELVSWGILFYAFSVLLVPMQDEFGWSAGTITGAYSFAILISGFLAPWVGRWIDARGARLLMTFGSTLGAVMVYAWSQVDSIVGLYLVWIGIGVAAACTLYDPAFAAIAPWFRHNRAHAMLIVTFLGGLASTVFLPVTGWLEDRYGWRDALVILAIFLAISTILPHLLVLRAPAVDGPTRTRPNTLAAIKELLQTPWFRRLALAFFLQSFTSVAVAVHMIAYLIDNGVTPTTAAVTTGVIGAAQTGARVMITIFERVTDVATLTSWMFALQMVAVVMLVVWPSGFAMVTAAILLGFGRGALTLLRPAILLEHYNVHEFGAVNGSLSAILTLATASAPVVTGLAVGWFDTYTIVFSAYAVVSLVSALLLLSLRAVPAPPRTDAP